jgi:hypothetical protein
MAETAVGQHMLVTAAAWGARPGAAMLQHQNAA